MFVEEAEITMRVGVMVTGQCPNIEGG